MLQGRRQDGKVDPDTRGTATNAQALVRNGGKKQLPGTSAMLTWLVAWAADVVNKLKVQEGGKMVYACTTGTDVIMRLRDRTRTFVWNRHRKGNCFIELRNV